MDKTIALHVIISVLIDLQRGVGDYDKQKSFLTGTNKVGAYYFDSAGLIPFIPERVEFLRGLTVY
jgi:hypothetical protein